MPTTLPRTQITRDARVERIIDVGRRHRRGERPGEVLVALAEERARQLEAIDPEPDPLAGLITIPANGRRVTRRMVEDALDELD